ncbi:polyribonucleotide nucleotidyltransferase [Oligella ureolytica]
MAWFGDEQMQAAINAINDLVEKAGKPAWDWEAAPKNEALIALVKESAVEGLQAA